MALFRNHACGAERQDVEDVPRETVSISDFESGADSAPRRRAPQAESLGDIGQIVSSVDRAAEASREAGEQIHVSTLAGLFCPRRLWLYRELGATAPLRQINSADRLLWSFGKAAEEHVVSSYIKATGGVGVFGRWACKCGKSAYIGVRRPGVESCPICGFELDVYSQFVLQDDRLNIVGSPDLLIDVRNEGLVPVEIKSVMSDDIDRQVTDAAHLSQGKWYWYLLDHAGYTMANYVAILYVNRKYLFGRRMYKQNNHSVEQEDIRHMDSIIGQVDLYRKAQSRPARVCASEKAGSRCGCALPKVCFQV